MDEWRRTLEAAVASAIQTWPAPLRTEESTQALTLAFAQLVHALDAAPFVHVPITLMKDLVITAGPEERGGTLEVWSECLSCDVATDHVRDPPLPHDPECLYVAGCVLLGLEPEPVGKPATWSTAEAAPDPKGMAQLAEAFEDTTLAGQGLLDQMAEFERLWHEAAVEGAFDPRWCDCPETPGEDLSRSTCLRCDLPRRLLRVDLDQAVAESGTFVHGWGLRHGGNCTACGYLEAAVFIGCPRCGEPTDTPHCWVVVELGRTS